ncbi:DUF2269 domain-containing protein [Fulvimarina sp. MAC3]|uniref:DUF2269 family protein n=1 Tax=Fulvimarina sp. MAC3 TaxID=3148887 RepID=UPI0031FC0AA0
MESYLWIKYVHLIGATVIFGTGLGTAFQMLSAHRSGEVRGIALVARNVVKADWFFTTPAVIIQPLTGATMAIYMGYSIWDRWLWMSILLYALAGACWLPVVWLQLRMRDLAAQAAEKGTPLPPDYHRLFRCWFALGWPAFGAVLVIFHLMIQKPLG